jgi:hypothetical protein
MESPFRLFLQLAFRDPAAVLKEMLFGQSEALIPDTSRLPVAGPKPLEVRLRCCFWEKKTTNSSPTTLCLEVGDFLGKYIKQGGERYSHA